MIHTDRESSRHLEASRELRLRPHKTAGEAMAAAQPKTGKRLGGMAEALGFPAPPPQVRCRPLAPRLTAISLSILATENLPLCSLRYPRLR
jgi:hypothetical protein